MRTFPNPQNYPCPYCGALKGEHCTNKLGQPIEGAHFSREPQTTYSTDADKTTIQFLTNLIVRGN
jgi:hypothetical protein